MNHAMKALPALLALACAGCISVLPEPKDAAPRYDVALPEAPAAAPETVPARILVIGKVRAAEEASGRAIRTADLETGRTGRLSDGELALLAQIFHTDPIQGLQAVRSLNRGLCLACQLCNLLFHPKTSSRNYP